MSETSKNTDINTLRHYVAECVRERGYLDCFSTNVLIIRQVLKTLEELGEVARWAFDTDGHFIPPEEIADVLTPMFVIADVLDIDLEQEIINKVTADIERGVRQAQGVKQNREE